MTRRILHVAQPVEGGVATVVLDYVLALRDAGDDVAVACPVPSPLADSVAALGIPVLAWSATRSPGPGVVDEARRLGQLITEWSPDLVHLHSAKAGLAGRLAVRGRRPTIFQPHAWSFAAVGGAMRVVSMWWERFAARWTDTVICVSEAERHAAPSARIRRICSVIANTVDPERWPIADRSTARAALGFTEDVPLAVCVGRLCEQKGQDTLLAIWPEVLTRVPTAELVVVGDGPMAAELTAAAGSHVQLVGAQSVKDWYAAADVVVVPSRWEAMAMVPLEAQAFGRCVVAFDVDGIRESLGPTNAIVPSGDSAEFAEVLGTLLGDLAHTRHRGEAGRATTLAHWSAGDLPARLHTEYDLVLAHRQGHRPTSTTTAQEAHS